MLAPCVDFGNDYVYILCCTLDRYTCMDWCLSASSDDLLSDELGTCPFSFSRKNLTLQVLLCGEAICTFRTWVKSFSLSSFVRGCKYTIRLVYCQWHQHRFILPEPQFECASLRGDHADIGSWMSWGDVRIRIVSVISESQDRDLVDLCTWYLCIGD